MYLCWFDDNGKKAAAEKVAEACAAYFDRFKVRPTLVMVNEADLCVVDGVLVRSESFIHRNNFWVGMLIEEGRG